MAMIAFDGIAELAVVVEDLAAGEAFYTRLLGRPPAAQVPDRYVLFDVAGVRFILFRPGIMARVGAGHCGGAQHFAFRIRPEEVEAALEHLRTLGITYLGPNHDPGKISIYFDDPAGNRVEFLAPTSAST
jgi:catechol 2,3-dioxygenase-like lactoylglutathione lyase family enzyme